MIRTIYIVMDFSCCQSVSEILRKYEIVNSPSYILLSGFESVRPPGILHFIRMKIAEAVYESS